MVQARLRRGEWEAVFRGLSGTAPAPDRAIRPCWPPVWPAGPRCRRVPPVRGLAVGPDRPAPPMPELTSAGRDQHGRRQKGDRHRTSRPTSTRRRTVLRRGIPCTDAVRTLVDLGAVVSRCRLTDAVDRALASPVGHRCRPARPSWTGSAAEAARGPAPLRRVAHRRGSSGAPHPSVLESRMLAAVPPLRPPEPAVEAGHRPGG